MSQETPEGHDERRCVGASGEGEEGTFRATISPWMKAMDESHGWKPWMKAMDESHLKMITLWSFGT